MSVFEPAIIGKEQEEGSVFRPKFDANGLVTAVACDVATNEVLMLAHMNAEALEKTKGWGLPIMTPKRRIAGEGYALIGDAGGMIEAFTGKGIGPGMMSART